jgi:hypothetical protein
MDSSQMPPGNTLWLGKKAKKNEHEVVYRLKSRSVADLYSQKSRLHYVMTHFRLFETK